MKWSEKHVMLPKNRTSSPKLSWGRWELVIYEWIVSSTAVNIWYIYVYPIFIYICRYLLYACRSYIVIEEITHKTIDEVNAQKPTNSGRESGHSKQLMAASKFITVAKIALLVSFTFGTNSYSMVAQCLWTCVLDFFELPAVKRLTQINLSKYNTI